MKQLLNRAFGMAILAMPPVSNKPIEELMRMQSQGKYLTQDEKTLVNMEAIKRRKK